MVIATISANRAVLDELLARPGVIRQRAGYNVIDLAAEEYQVTIMCEPSVFNSFPPSTANFQYYKKIHLEQDQYLDAWTFIRNSPNIALSADDLFAFSS